MNEFSRTNKTLTLIVNKRILKSKLPVNVETGINTGGNVIVTAIAGANVKAGKTN